VPEIPIPSTTSSRAVYSVDEFCDSHDLSRTTYFQLEKEGRGPRSMKIGRRRLITLEAAAEWRASMEAETETNRTGAAPVPVRVAPRSPPTAPDLLPQSSAAPKGRGRPAKAPATPAPGPATSPTRKRRSAAETTPSEVTS